MRYIIHTEDEIPCDDIKTPELETLLGVIQTELARRARIEKFKLFEIPKDMWENFVWCQENVPWYGFQNFASRLKKTANSNTTKLFVHMNKSWLVNTKTKSVKFYSESHRDWCTSARVPTAIQDYLSENK